MNKSLQQLLSLEGKTAVITGGAGYLGTAISETLAELGANIVLASRDRAKCARKCEEIVQQTGGSIRAVSLELDVLKKDSATHFFDQVHEHFKAVDILVNNAWSGNKNSWESITDEDWEHDINMSLNSVFRMTKAAFPDLKKTRGVILNIASMYGHIGPDYRIYDGKQFANPPSYGAAKAGVIQFTKYLASFLSPHGIRINALSPGAFPHPPTQKHEEFMQRLASKNPMNRIGQPEELKGAVALLCSDAGSYITGQNLCVEWRLGNMVKSMGIIGLSEGNGHPFSYSSIVNGYSDEGLAKSGWPGIYDYVRRRHRSEFGIEGMAITHAWTQDPDVTERLCAACLIPNAVKDRQDLMGAVDAVIIARDDYETHFQMARPFLEAGLPVFVDKPLSLELSELRAFKPYLEKGQLMSCSGMRYSRELDEPRADLAAYGRLKLIRGAIVLSWEKYGIHLLEASLALSMARPVSVRMSLAEHASAVVSLEDGVSIQIDALGECARTFHIEIFGTQRNGAFDITDNFSMFRRMLWQFAESIRTGQPAIPPDRTLEIMRVLIAGRMARNENREVFLNELTL